MIKSKVVRRVVMIAWIITLLVLISIALKETDNPQAHNAPWISPEQVERLRIAKQEVIQAVETASTLEEELLSQMNIIGDYVEDNSLFYTTTWND